MINSQRNQILILQFEKWGATLSSFIYHLVCYQSIYIPFARLVLYLLTTIKRNNEIIVLFYVYHSSWTQY